MHKFTLLYFAVMFLVITTNVYGQRGKPLGARSKVQDVKNNKEVQELGKFSVEEYNRSLQQVPPSPLSRTGSNGPLKFIEVVEAQKQVVSGIKYYLKVAAMQNGVSRTFDAIVVVKPWVMSKQLLNFGPSSSR